MTFKNTEIEQTYESETPIALGEVYEPSDLVEIGGQPPVNDSFLGLLSNCPSMHATEIDGVKWTDVTRKVMNSISDRMFSSPQAARQMRCRSAECHYRRDKNEKF